MPEPFPHQIAGATFLAGRPQALLADEQRVGKTGAAIRACDYLMARRILVVTTASARQQWGREFREWGFPRDIQVVLRTAAGAVRQDAEVVIVGWSVVHRLIDQLTKHRWEVLIVDESHYAKSPGAQRTQAVFGENGLHKFADRVMCLSGTPVPNSPADLWPMLSALAPERIGHLDFEAFKQRYCVVAYRNAGNGQLVEVIKGGKNLDELTPKVDGFWLRRTQQDVGIRPPIYSVFALTVDKLPQDLLDDEEAQLVLAAAETGDTQALEMHLGPIRRLTGTMKAYAAAEAAAEALENGLDKLVLMAWHTDAIDVLYSQLAAYRPVGIDGRTKPRDRDGIVGRFVGAEHRVFIGQIQAAGEAIDLSAAAELWFVEPSFTPKDMSQAALRITNHSQKRQALVRVCALAGSIDEALMAILTRKVASIRQLVRTSA